jgi:predicted component of type VI protein secretion system
MDSDLNVEFARATITYPIETWNERCTLCGSFCTFNEKKNSGEKDPKYF